MVTRYSYVRPAYKGPVAGVEPIVNSSSSVLDSHTWQSPIVVSMTQYTSRCLCKSSSIEIEGPVEFLLVCHCRDCQTVSGGSE
jgi:hypothetical protein